MPTKMIVKNVDTEEFLTEFDIMPGQQGPQPFGLIEDDTLDSSKSYDIIEITTKYTKLSQTSNLRSLTVIVGVRVSDKEKKKENTPINNLVNSES